MCGASLKDRMTGEELRKRVWVEPITIDRVCWDCMEMWGREDWVGTYRRSLLDGGPCYEHIPQLGTTIIGRNTLGSCPWMALSSLKDIQYRYSSKQSGHLNPSEETGTGAPSLIEVFSVDL